MSRISCKMRRSFLVHLTAHVSKGLKSRIRPIVGRSKESMEKLVSAAKHRYAAAKQEKINFDLKNHEIEKVGKKERFRRNIQAISVLKKCESESRLATSEEQIVLSKYVGWGGIPEAYDENNAAWYEPELTEEMELKLRVCYTYADGAEGVWCLQKISSPVPVEKIIGYDDKTYDILFYDDFSNVSADLDPCKDVRNMYGINGGVVPRWDCRYILHDLITEGIEEEGDVDTSVKAEVLGDFKVSDEVKEELRQIYTKEWKGKEGLMVHKTEDLFDIEPFCWKLFAVKSSIEIKQIELTADDDRQVVSV